MLALREQCLACLAVVQVQGPLRAPVDVALRQAVGAVLRRGQRLLLVDVTGVAEIDAAGVGELVHVYGMAAAVDGVLRLTHLTAMVRTLLDRAGLLELLSADSILYREKCS